MPTTFQSTCLRLALKAQAIPMITAMPSTPRADGSWRSNPVSGAGVPCANAGAEAATAVQGAISGGFIMEGVGEEAEMRSWTMQPTTGWMFTYRRNGVAKDLVASDPCSGPCLHRATPNRSTTINSSAPALDLVAQFGGPLVILVLQRFFQHLELQLIHGGARRGGLVVRPCAPSVLPPSVLIALPPPSGRRR
jgi:hypothetical protein